MSFCAPNRSQNDWSCFTVDELLLMAIAWNQTNIGKKYPIYIDDMKSLTILDKSNSNTTNNSPEYLRKYIWKELRDRFKPFCGNNEACWLDSENLRKELKKLSPKMYRIINHFTLRPKSTQGSHDWLSTNEIDFVMQQYEQIYSNFKYLGCFPSDYYELNPSQFIKDINSLHDKKYAAIVFNLDESHQKGSHWIAVFFEFIHSSSSNNKFQPKNDLTTPHKLMVEFFDPTGDNPNKNLKAFLKNLQNFVGCKQNYPTSSLPSGKARSCLEPTTVNITISKTKHQRGNNECGMYSLYYILQRLSGKTFNDINKTRISDSSMNHFRAYLFRPFSKSF